MTDDLQELSLKIQNESQEFLIGLESRVEGWKTTANCKTGPNSQVKHQVLLKSQTILTYNLYTLTSKA